MRLIPVVQMKAREVERTRTAPLSNFSLIYGHGNESNIFWKVLIAQSISNLVYRKHLDFYPKIIGKSRTALSKEHLDTM